MDIKPISQEKVETKRAITSQCGTPVLRSSPRLASEQRGPVAILPFLNLGRDYLAYKCEVLTNLPITVLLNVSVGPLRLVPPTYTTNGSSQLTLAPTFKKQ